MGYRSQVIIGVDKKIYDHQLIMGTVPTCLITHAGELITAEANGSNIDAMYWELDHWKWYDTYPDVRAILEWFELLDQEEELAVLIRPKIVSQWDNTKEFHDDHPPYGAVRTGEEKDDIEEMGDPSLYEISVDVSIISPLDYL